MGICRTNMIGFSYDSISTIQIPIASTLFETISLLLSKLITIVIDLAPYRAYMRLYSIPIEAYRSSLV